MNQTIVIGLVNNAALLLTLALVYEGSDRYPVKNSRLAQMISGVLISIICILIMKTPLELQPGIMIDARSVLISSTALIFGPVSTIVTVISAIAYRLYSGGMGALPGIGIIVTSSLIGTAWRFNLYTRFQKKWGWLNLYLMGFSCHIAMLICLFTLPYPESISVLRDVGVAVLLIYPVFTVILCLLMLRLQEKKVYQQQLEQSEEQFQMLFHQAPIGYQSLNEDGCFLNVNQRWLDTLGYTREEVLGKWFGDFLAPESKEAFSRQFPVFKARGYTQSEMKLIHKSGKQMDFKIEGKIGLDRSGMFKQTHCILQDVTALKMKEKFLNNSELKYRCLFDSMIDGILIFEADSGIITDINAQLLNLLEYSEDFFIGKKIWSLGLFHEITRNRFEIMMLKDDQHLRLEDTSLITLSGVSRSVEIVLSTFQVKDQKMFLVNIREIPYHRSGRYLNMGFQRESIG